MKDKNIKQMEGGGKVFETEWFYIEAVTEGWPGNRLYYRLTSDDSVEILAFTPDKKIILVRQFRPAVQMFMLELPAGHVDRGESPEQAVRRELHEETGYACESVTNLGPFKISPSRINSTLHLFYGQGARVVEVGKRKSDGIEVVLVSREEFESLVKDGKFQEVAGIASFWLAEKAGLLK